MLLGKLQGKLQGKLLVKLGWTKFLRTRCVAAAEVEAVAAAAGEIPFETLMKSPRSGRRRRRRRRVAEGSAKTEKKEAHCLEGKLNSNRKGYKYCTYM